MLGARRFWREVDDDEHNKTKQNKTKAFQAQKPQIHPNPAQRCTACCATALAFLQAQMACVGVRCLWRSRVGSIRTLCGEQVCTLNSAPDTCHASYNSTNWGKTKPNTTKKTNKQTNNKQQQHLISAPKGKNEQEKKKKRRKEETTTTGKRQQTTNHPPLFLAIHPSSHPSNPSTPLNPKRIDTDRQHRQTTQTKQHAQFGPDPPRLTHNKKERTPRARKRLHLFFRKHGTCLCR